MLYPLTVYHCLWYEITLLQLLETLRTIILTTSLKLASYFEAKEVTGLQSFLGESWRIIFAVRGKKEEWGGEEGQEK